MAFEGTNGALAQLQREQTEKLSELEIILKDGFSEVAQAVNLLNGEVSKIREKLVDALVSLVGQVIKTLCWVFLAIIVWVTGLKALPSLANILQ